MNFIEKLISNFIRKYAKVMDIHLSPSLVTFYQGNRSIQAEPILCIDDKGNEATILGWSRSVKTDVNCIRINVLDYKEFEKYPSLHQEECLAELFKIAMRELQVETSIVRPIIRVHDASSLSKQKDMDIKTVIDNALNKCGAQKVEFV